MADRTAGRRSGDGIHGAILGTGVGSTGAVLETDLPETRRYWPNVGSATSLSFFNVSLSAATACGLVIALMSLRPSAVSFGLTELAMQRESNLIATIRKKLPDFARMCPDDAEYVLLHQDAFADDYQEDEYMLLGMAIKYVGLCGKEVRVIGKNRSSLGEEDRIQ
jgi:hypothetical protein